MLIDTHCHLDAAEFDSDRAEVLSRARAQGVFAQIIPAVAFESWTALRDLCRSEDDLFPAYGLHPMYLDRHAPEHLDRLALWIEREKPCAVGECGLDFFVEGLDPDRQRRYFIRQLEIAREFDLPVILHARRALDEVILALRRIGELRGVVHSFSGSAEQARQLWALGFHVGIGGPVTYDRAKRLRDLVAHLPIEQLLLETDSPDQPTAAHRGQRNQPSRLCEVAQTVAQLRDIDLPTLAVATTRNARALFRLGELGAGRASAPPSGPCA